MPKLLKQSPNIIADALHVTYSTDKGRFNLDEAARHISNEWNKIRTHLLEGKSTSTKIKKIFNYKFLI